MNTADAKPLVPPAIEKVIADFNAAGAPLDEHQVNQALIAARKTLTNPSDTENLGASAEVLAFALADGKHGSSPWGTYFRPVGSGTKQDGSTFYSPDIAGTDAEVVAHWAQRAGTVTHPVLKARYADLAWDMSRAIAKTNPDPTMARTAIDAYIASITGSLRRDVHDKFDASLRALNLAMTIGDDARKEAAKAALLDLHRETVASRKGLWWIAFDRLIDDKRVGLTDAERDQFVADLEGVVTRHSNKATFDPHATESAATRLIKYYGKRSKSSDAKRLNQVIAQTFEHFASLGDAMLASAVLQTALNAYRDAGMRDESRRVRVLMEERIEQSRDQMKPVVIERTIPKEDMDRFLDSVVVGNLATTFVRIASEFLQGRKELERQIAKESEDAPLMATITQSIMADNHIAAQIGSVEDDPFGRLIHRAAQGMDFADIWLIRALDRAIEVHDVRPGHFATWAARTKLFDDLTLLMEGVTAWYDQDFVKAVHVFVPQIEVGLRGIVGTLGKPVTKPHSTVAGVSVAIGMGDNLYSKEVAAALSDDLTLHFLSLYADPRGFNLRNDLAHGLLGADRIHFSVACKVLHSLLVLGIWDELAEARNAADNT